MSHLNTFFLFVLKLNLKEINCFQKVITSFTAVSTSSTGASYGPQNISSQKFVANDRGCLPTLAAGSLSLIGPIDGVPQTTQQQMTLGSTSTNSTSEGVINDYNTLVSNLCNIYGTCCYKQICNRANKMISNENIFSLLVFYLILILNE